MAKRSTRPRARAKDSDLPVVVEARRTLLVGAQGDPTMASYPLGPMFARRYINQDQHNAGVYFGYLYASVIDRRRTAKAVNLDTTKGFYRDHETRGDIHRQKMCWQLVELTHPWPIIRSACCYDEFPNFLFSTSWKPKDLCEIRDLQVGLSAIHNHLTKIHGSYTHV